MERCKNHLPFRTWRMEKWNVFSRIFLQTLETQMTSLAYLLVLEDPYLVSDCLCLLLQQWQMVDTLC